MAWGDLDGVLTQAVASGDVPFAVGMVGSSAGTLWSGAAGDRCPGAPATLDTVFRVFSMTKAVGSFCAMLLIDRGRLTLETPVVEVLPEFAGIMVLDGFDGDAPRLRAPRTTATLRHLATHTSGFAYEFWNADIARWKAAVDHPTVVSGQLRSLHYPLAFDPGTAWDYGLGIDWLGRMVEAADGRPIDAFCRDEIFGPLAMADTAFELEPHLAPRSADLSARTENGGFAPFALAPPARPEFYGMGHALYSTAPDYLRFLRMILNGGALDGVRLIGADTLAALLGNQIGALRIGRLPTVAPALSADIDLFPGTPKTHSLAFMRVEADVPGMRAAGSQGWAGVCNTHYWIDPARDRAGILMTQSLPFVEPRFLATYGAFERAVYAA